MVLTEHDLIRWGNRIGREVMGPLFLGLKACRMLRVSREEEMEGLDIGEHGMHAYGLTER